MRTTNEIVLGVVLVLLVVAGGAYSLARYPQGTSGSLQFTHQLESLARESTRDEQVLNKALTLTLLHLIQDNKAEVEKYLTTYKDASDPERSSLWTTILQDYTLVFLPGGFENDGFGTEALQGNTIFDLLQDDTFPHPVIAQVSPRPDGSYVVEVDSIYLSGAYNIVADFYLISLTGNSVALQSLPPLWIDQKGNISSDELYNAHYVPTEDVVEVYGMLPFGLYPCNDIVIFNIYQDRLIQAKEEEKVACHGKDIESPDDVFAFPESTDFEARQLLYAVAPATLEKALRLDLSTLPTQTNDY